MIRSRAVSVSIAGILLMTSRKRSKTTSSSTGLVYGGQPCTCDDAPIVTTCAGWATGACPIDPVEDCLTQTPNGLEGLAESEEESSSLEVTPTTHEPDMRTDRDGTSADGDASEPAAGKFDRKE